jgi:hypothetical protein
LNSSPDSVALLLTVRSKFDEISKSSYTPSIKEMLNIETKHVDDISLLFSHIQHMNIVKLIDDLITVHGNKKWIKFGKCDNGLVIPSK